MSGDVLAAVERALRLVGPPFRLVGSRATPWASATFAGHRVTLTIAATGEALETRLAALAEADLPMRGRFAADCVVEGRRRHGAEELVDLALLVIDAS